MAKLQELIGQLETIVEKEAKQKEDEQTSISEENRENNELVNNVSNSIEQK